MTDFVRLYVYNTSQNEYEEMIPGYKQNYLSSNVDYIDPRDGKKKPFAQRYRKFTTRNHGIRVLAFGFLFDFTGNDENTVVQPVEETVREEWFQDAIRDKDVDIFVVAGHIGIRQVEYQKLYESMRGVRWDIPIVFLGGHFHIRDYKKFDDKAFGLASGRYMETVGFQSVSGLPSRKTEDQVLTGNPSFARRYIDNNLYSYFHHTSLNESTFPTGQGRNISAFIAKSRQQLQLDQRYGCAPQHYWMARTPYPQDDSIFTWLDSQVVPEMVVEPERANNSRIIIGNTGAMRFDIFQGPFTKDTAYIVSPFTSGFRFVEKVPFRIADRLLEVLNNAGNILELTMLSDFGTRQLEPPAQDITLRNRPSHITMPDSQFPLLRVQGPLSSEPDLVPGYTTTDDAGSDGDDTVHSPITFYKVPPCFESRVNVNENAGPEDLVDVIYLEFVQPWVLAALTFLGAEYKERDTASYMEGKGFTELITEWVKENWKGDC